MLHRPASESLRSFTAELKAQAQAEAEAEAANEYRKEAKQELIEHRLWLADFDIERSLEIIKETKDLAVIESFICYFEDIEALKRRWLENPDTDFVEVKGGFARAADLLHLELGKEGAERYEKAASSKELPLGNILPSPSLASLTDTSYIERLFQELDRDRGK